MFPNDVLAGMILVVSLILTVVGLVAYRRYRLRGILFSTVAFLIFLVESLIYVFNIFFNLQLDVLFWLLLLNLAILVTLYFSISLKG